ncbi:unnamed protein product [Cylicocyclus nassatus]|uniref:Prostaglandin E synthase 2 n=1 Tax=Cylicocyclus nassatus TaxID=53992 RepID=A0AA36M5I3_CYLNA|nr:unnamed protein product [Cylicocyclus nassatus]
MVMLGMRIGLRAARAALATAVLATKVDDKIFVETTRRKDDKNVLFSRKIVNENDRTNLHLRLFQYQSCPFCCKVRAFLDYYGFSYDVVEVNPVTKAELKFSKEYKKVPILSTSAGTLTDSTLIISKLATFLASRSRTLSDVHELYPTVIVPRDGQNIMDYPHKYIVFPDGTSRNEDIASDRIERQWREWVDAYFIHLISPNVYRTFSESLETFRWFSEFGDWDNIFTVSGRALAVYVGAFAMWLIAKRLKKRHNIVDERRAMSEAFDEWMDAIGPNRDYLGGSKPNLADLGMYGAMTAFSGCSAFRELVTEGSKIERWFTRMRNEICIKLRSRERFEKILKGDEEQ